MSHLEVMQLQRARSTEAAYGPSPRLHEAIVNLRRGLQPPLITNRLSPSSTPMLRAIVAKLIPYMNRIVMLTWLWIAFIMQVAVEEYFWVDCHSGREELRSTIG